MIALRAKDIEFEVTYINLQEKPDWFLEISPHGKVPVLSVDGTPLFESNAIAEYLDEVVPPRLHPEDPIKRARNRAWTDFVPDFAKGLSGIYYTKSPDDREERLATARGRLDKLEEAIATERGNDGPYFNGPELSLVDAAYAPFLQRFLYVDQWLQTSLLDDYPLVAAWARALVASDVVRGSVPETFFDEFRSALKRRGFHVGELMERAQDASESDLFAKEIRLLEHAYALDPKDQGIQEKLAAAYLRIGNDKAAARFEFMLADLEEAYGNERGANEWREKALAHDPANLEARRAVVQFHLSREDRDKATEEWANAVAAFEEQVAWRNAAKGEIEAGLATYLDAIADTIGARQQEKLTRDQALYIAACNADHRDISLNF